MVKLPSLRAAREKAFWTQSELARQSGVASVTIARAEAGKDIRLGNALKLAEALNVKPEQLTEGLA